MDWKLQRHPSFGGVKGPVVACIMDGVGIGAQDESDAVWLARTPHLDWLAHQALATSLQAHGTAVGMPSDSDMGNSEVGHNALGCGRTFDQGAKLVSAAIADGRIFRGEVWRQLAERVRQSGEPMHFMGLLSDGNVHSHIDHLFALIRRCDEENVRAVRVHILLDGRDVPSTSALDYVDALEALLAALQRKPDRDYRIASGGGRMLVTMDRYEAARGRRSRPCGARAPARPIRISTPSSSRTTRAPSDPSATAPRWSSSTSAGTAPSSCAARSRRTTSRTSTGCSGPLPASPA
jgi:2,3-bisphosphoglycerate-independent phosphoglycerate mutase